MASFPHPGVIASGYLDPRRTGLNTHFGVDIAGKAGDPVSAPEDMEVVDVATSADPERKANTTLTGTSPLTKIPNPWMGYGPGIVLARGASGAFHLLAHLAEVDVQVGEHVAEGDHVGALATHVGVSGSHVHWEVRKSAIDTPDTRAGDTFDPVVWVKTGALKSAPPPPAGVPLWAVALGLWFLFR